jgi:membrane-associated phospholipid phosphatase
MTAPPNIPDTAVAADAREPSALPFVGIARASGALFAAFGLLTILIASTSAPLGPERAVDAALLAAPGTAMLEFGRAVSFLGSGTVVAVLSVVLAVGCLIARLDWRVAVLCVAGPAVAGMGETTMKQVVGRVRPSTRLLTHVGGYSFPSGHTTGAAALATVAAVAAWLLVRDRRIRTRIVVALIAYAVAVGISRIVVGAHYATDVVGGLLFGPAVALAVLLVIAWVSWGGFRHPRSLRR